MLRTLANWPICNSMSQPRIAIVPGDGVGPEIMDAVLAIFDAADFKAEYISLEAGQPAMDKGLPPMPDETIEEIRKIGIALKGPTATPIGKGHTSANVALRKALDLFANVRPTRSIPGVHGHFDDTAIDIIIVRENTEGLYSGIEFQPHKDMAQAVKVTTRPGCRRLAEYAFDMVKKQGRKRVTAVHKANIMKLTDGMLLEEFYKVAEKYPDVVADDIIVDNCCMQLVTKPQQFDVIVTENLYGDIVSDLCAGLVGGLGLASSANIGENCAVFEAVHGSAPDIAGKGIANPTALLFSGLMMLRHLGYNAEAKRIGSSVMRTLAAGQTVTRDIGGTASTMEFANAVIAGMRH